MFDILKVIDFFIKNKPSSDKNDYEQLKSVQEKFSDHNFINDCILLSLYSYINRLSLPFNVFMTNPDVMSFLQSYEENKRSLYIKNEDEFSKLEKTLFFDINFVKNKKELIPYLIIEAMVEYNKSSQMFFESNLQNNSVFSTEVYDSNPIAINSTNNLAYFDTVPNGFYIIKRNADDYSSYYSGSKYGIVSKQPSGLTFFNIENKLLGISGFKKQDKTFLNLINKTHSLDIELIKSNNNELTTDVQVPSYFNGFINKLVIRAFAYFSSINKEATQTTGFLGYVSNNKKETLFPVSTNYKTANMPFYTFDDLRFSGEYNHLAFIDDLLEDILDLKFVNYYSDKIEYLHCLSHVDSYKGLGELSLKELNNLLSEDTTKEKEKEVDIFSKQYCNSFEIEIKTRQTFLNHYENSTIKLIPINPYFFGSEEDIKKYSLRIAKSNKLKMYSFYLKQYITKNIKSFTSEITEFLNENIKSLLDDNDFLETIERVGLANNSDRNSSGLGYSSSSSLITKEKYITINPNSSYDNLLSFSDLDLLDYKGKSKGKNLIAFNCGNLEMLSILENKYGLSLSNTSQKIIDIFKSSLILQDVRNKTNQHGGSLLRFNDSDCDIELYDWLHTSVLFHIIVPMTDKNKKVFSAKIEVINKAVILNCNFGYSNGSRDFY